MAVDASGNVIAGGFLFNNETGPAFAVVKLDGEDGVELWRTEIDRINNCCSDHEARSVAVDASGNVFAGGQISNPGTDADFAVVKLDGEDGSKLIGTPRASLTALVDAVVALNLEMGITNSLDPKLDEAENALDDFNVNNDVAAINALQAFIDAVAAQSGMLIAEADAAALIAAAEDIIIALLSGG